MLRFSNGFFVNWLRTFQPANSFIEYSIILISERRRRRTKERNNKINQIPFILCHTISRELRLISSLRKWKHFQEFQARKFSNNKAYVDIFLFVVDFVIVFIACHPLFEILPFQMSNFPTQIGSQPHVCHSIFFP